MQTMSAKVEMKASKDETSTGRASVAFRLLTVEDQLRRLVELQNLYGNKSMYSNTVSASRDIGSSVGTFPRDELLSMSKSVMSGQNIESKSHAESIRDAQNGLHISKYNNLNNVVANAVCGFPKLQDLPVDLPEFGDELDNVPSLEELILDVGAAEAELFAQQQLSDAGIPQGGVFVRGMMVTNNETRSTVLEPAQSLPAGGSRRDREHRRSKSIGHLSKLEILGKRRADECHVSNVMKAQQSHPRSLDSPMEDASSFENMAGSSAAVQPNKTDIKARTSPSADDVYLVNRVEACQTPFAAYSSVPLPTDATVNAIANANLNVKLEGANLAHNAACLSTDIHRAKISGANSMPNRHWLSPGVALSTARASKPPDEKVLKWLLDGQKLIR